MPTNERVISLLLRFRVDAESAKKTQAEFAKLEKSYNHVTETTVKINRQLAEVARSRHIGKLADEFRRVETETGSTSKALARLSQELTKIGASDAEIKRVTNAIVNMNTEASKSSALGSLIGKDRLDAAAAGEGGGRWLGGRGSKLAQFGTELRALPAVGLPGMPFSSDALAKMLNLVGRIDPAFLKVGLAGGAMAAVMLLAADSLNKAKEAALADLNARQKALELIKTGSREQIQTRIEELQKERQLREQALKDAETVRQKLQQETQKQFGDVVGGLEIVGGALGLGHFAAVTEDVNAANKALTETSTELNLLQQAANAASFDVGELNKQLSQYRIEAARDTVERLRFESEAFDMTGEQLAKTLSDNAREMGGLQVALKALVESGDTSKEVTDQIRSYQSELVKLRDQQRFLIDIAGPYIDAREAQAAADERAKEAAEKLAEQADELAKAAESAEKAQAQYNKKLDEIASEVLQRIADAAKDRDKALNDAYADAAKDRKKIIDDVQDDLNEAERKSLQDRVDAEREHQKAVKKILRDGARDQQTAIEDRDAVALDRARRAQQDALDSENENYQERIRKVDQALAEENRQINKRYIQQLQEVDARLYQQVQQAVTRYNEQLTAAYTYGQRQREVALQALNTHLTDLQKSLTVEKQYRDGAYRAMMQGAKVYADYLLSVAAQLRNAASGNRTTGGGGAKKPIQFAAGISRGLAPAFRDVMVGERGPEIMRLPTRAGVFTPQQYMRAGGASVTVQPGGIVINGSKLDARQLENVVTRALTQAVKEI